MRIHTRPRSHRPRSRAASRNCTGIRGHVFRISLVSCALVPLLASAATVPMGGSPLAVHLGDRGQLQAFESGSTSGIFYPPSGTAGDAGFFLAFPTGAPVA